MNREKNHTVHKKADGTYEVIEDTREEVGLGEWISMTIEEATNIVNKLNQYQLEAAKVSKN